MTVKKQIRKELNSIVHTTLYLKTGKTKSEFVNGANIDNLITLFDKALFLQKDEIKEILKKHINETKWDSDTYNDVANTTIANYLSVVMPEIDKL